ncbi:MAG: pilus assembly protein PilM [Desulfobacterota bacterium]|nr:pilus assembly protein PilM [Thermodesulfobacteriota bacterium]
MQSIGVVIKKHEMVMVALKQGVRRIYLDAYRIVPLPDAVQERQETMLLNLERFIKTYRNARDNIFIGIPRSSVVVSLLLLPAALEENLRTSIGYEIDKYTPFAYEEVYFDCQVLRRIPDAGLIHVLLITVRREVIDEYLNLFKKIGGKPRGIEPTTTALLGVIPERHPIQHDAHGVPALRFSIMQNLKLDRIYQKVGVPYMRTLLHPTGANQPVPGIDIVIECLDPATYEIDIIDGGCLCSSEVVTVAQAEHNHEPIWKTLHARATTALIHVPHNPSRTADSVRVMLSGREWSAEMLEQAAAVWGQPPFVVHELPAAVQPATDVPAALMPVLAAPIVLARKGIKSSARDINLIPPERRLKKKRDMRKLVAAGCGTIIVLGATAGGIKTALDMRSELAVLTQEVAELKKQVRSIEALQEDARKAEQLVADLARIRSDDISKIKLLEELTTIIPHDSFLTECHYKADEKKVRLTGYAASASSLIPLLEGSPLFDNVKFTSPITTDKRTGKERFRIEMNLSQGGSQPHETQAP